MHIRREKHPWIVLSNFGFFPPVRYSFQGTFLCKLSSYLNTLCTVSTAQWLLGCYFKLNILLLLLLLNTIKIKGHSLTFAVITVSQQVSQL